MALEPIYDSNLTPLPAAKPPTRLTPKPGKKVSRKHLGRDLGSRDFAHSIQQQRLPAANKKNANMPDRSRERTNERGDRKRISSAVVVSKSFQKAQEKR